MYFLKNFLLKIKVFFSTLILWYDNQNQGRQIIIQQIFCVGSVIFVFIQLPLEHYFPRPKVGHSLLWEKIIPCMIIVQGFVVSFGILIFLFRSNYLNKQKILDKCQKNKDELDKIRALNERNWFYSDFNFLHGWMKKKRENIKKKIL